MFDDQLCMFEIISGRFVQVTKLTNGFCDGCAEPIPIFPKYHPLYENRCIIVTCLYRDGLCLSSSFNKWSIERRCSMNQPPLSHEVDPEGVERTCVDTRISNTRLLNIVSNLSLNLHSGIVCMYAINILLEGD